MFDDNSCGVPPDPNIELFDPEVFQGGSVSGNAACWNASTSDRAPYWEDKKPKVLQFAESLIGAATGNPPKSDENKKLDLDET